MSGLEPLARRSVVDEAVDTMRARILHGHWAPDSTVPTEKELTEAMGVSRSTPGCSLPSCTLYVYCTSAVRLLANEIQRRTL